MNWKLLSSILHCIDEEEKMVQSNLETRSSRMLQKDNTVDLSLRHE